MEIGNSLDVDELLELLEKDKQEKDARKARRASKKLAQSPPLCFVSFPDLNFCDYWFPPGIENWLPVAVPGSADEISTPAGSCCDHVFAIIAVADLVLRLRESSRNDYTFTNELGVFFNNYCPNCGAKMRASAGS